MRPVDVQAQPIRRGTSGQTYCSAKPMRVSIVVCVAVVLLAGCASQAPQTPAPKNDPNAAALLGTLLLANAAQDKGSAAHELWQVKIPPTAVAVISNIEDQK